MSKVTNIILMLDYLNTGHKYTVKELSDKLGVSNRMIRYYKQELETVGIYINVDMGPGGGYYIEKNGRGYRNFTYSDIELLESIRNILSKNNFLYFERYEKMLNKVKDIYEIEKEKSKYTDYIDEKDSNQILERIKNALENKERLLVIYQDISGILNERWIHPMHVFKYDNEIYITVFCELRKDLRQFELKRIKEIKE